MQTSAKPMRPAMFTAHHLIRGILEGDYPPGSRLPDERTLARQLGITRPTLRETLQRMAQEGWITIAHGKPTRVNDFWQTGGLGLLGTLARHSDQLSNGFVIHLLELRLCLMPVIAQAAVVSVPELILEHLDAFENLDDDPEAFGAFDWQLQMLMARHCGNPIYPLLLNDFAPLYQKMAAPYFRKTSARSASLDYYHRLRRAICSDAGAVGELVRAVMQKSIELWRSGRSKENESA